MDDQGIELLGGTLAQDQPAGSLDQQEQRTQGNDQPLLSAFFPAAGDGGAEEQPLEQYQSVIERAQRGQK